MNLLVLPFDLRLWTGQDASTYTEEVFLRFVERRDLTRQLQQKLSKSALQTYRLCIPLTQHLYEQLTNTPSWSEARRVTALYRLKRNVLALLRNKNQTDGLTLRFNIEDIVHLYTWESPETFFVPALSALRESWVEMVGLSAFEPAVSAQGFDQPLPILGCCIVTAYTEAAHAQITRRSLTKPVTEETRSVPLLSDLDV